MPPFALSGIARSAVLVSALVCSAGLAAAATPGDPPAFDPFAPPSASSADAGPANVDPKNAGAPAISAEDFARLIERLDRAEAEVRNLRMRLDASAAQPASDAAGGGPTAVDPFSPAPPFRTVTMQEDVTPPDRGVADQALIIPGERPNTAAGPRDDEFEARLTDLEEIFQEEKAEALQEQFEALGDRIGNVEDGLSKYVTRGTRNSKVQLFGRLHADYYGFPDSDAGAARSEGENPQDRFLFRRLRIGVKGDISTNMFYKMETEFAAVNDFEIRDLYFGYR
ncbi:MAG: porin, partial [Planctomycetota bacterium]